MSGKANAVKLAQDEILERSVDPKVMERNAKFKSWLTNKSLRDKAIELLGKISPSRAEDDSDLKEVAIALCAVDEILKLSGANNTEKQTKIISEEDMEEDDENQDNKNSNKKNSGGNTSSSSSGPKPLRTYWMKWAMERHNFNMIELTDNEVATLSAAVHEYLDTSEKGKTILPSLKYFFPAIPKKPNEKAKPLTNDQKAQNVFYMKQMTRVWKESKEELNNRLREYVTRKQQQIMKGASENSDITSSSSSSLSSSIQSKLELQGLNEMSLRQLNTWVEEDEDKAAKLANEDEQERMKNAKNTHETWVKNKDSLRIRIPENLPHKPPPITYGREFSGVRPQTGPSSLSILQSMADSGLKYVHASGKGKQGTDGDLEKTRKSLLDLGYVYRENFDTDQLSEYYHHRRNNPALRERKESQKKSKEDSAKAYEDWLIYKDMKDQALKCLNLLPVTLRKPTTNPSDESNSNTMNNNNNIGPRHSIGSVGSYTSTSTTKKSISQTKAVIQYSNQDIDRIIDIGKALKKVDRTLFTDWSKWCEGIIKPSIATILWDAFSPIACDVHSMSYSQIRDTFMKLLRPGFDFKTVFTDFAHKLNPNDNYDDRQADGKDKMNDISLDKDQMQKLLRQMGIAMKPSEMRILIDAFDANNDGTITLQEFLDFTGPKRDKKSGSGMALNRRCCWLTTCKITGMTNAYVVSALPKNGRGSTLNYLMESKNEAKVSSGSIRDSKETDTDVIGNTMEGLAGKIEVKTLPSGEKRMFVELKERKTREDILRSYRVLSPDDSTMNVSKTSGASALMTSDKKLVRKGSKSNNRRDMKGDNRDDYDDDDFDHNDHDDYEQDFDDNNDNNNDRNRSTSISLKSSDMDRCDASKWTREDRAEGLQYLLDISRDVRQEDVLKTLLTQGNPPKPPLFWCEFDPVSDESDRVKLDELRLCWGPQKGDLVSFYSLEYAGISKLNQGSDILYKEIFRDPSDAHPDNKFQFSYVMSDLKPGTSYLFRLRGFNGYGPGDFVYKVFTTKTGAPPAPRPITISSDAVVLRWLFSDAFNKRMNELKRIFMLADSDKSGSVSREELIAILDDKVTDSSELKKFLVKSAVSRGIDISRGFSAMFDAIEGDDDGMLSWNEFEDFFMSAGWGDTSTVASSAAAAVVSTSQDKLRLSTSNSINKITPTTITYVVEKCESEFDNVYSIVVKTTSGKALITRLEPGQSYRFRVYSINVDGVPGPKSDSVVIHTMLEMPAPPSVTTNNGIGTTSLTLTWKARIQTQSTRSKQVVDRMLGDWAGTHHDDDKGVSIEAAFAKYDRDGSGDIDATEMAVMLNDLGVEATEERIRLAIDVLDINGDGKISFEEFSKWWRREDVSYTVKRSEAVMPMTSISSRLNILRGSNIISSQATGIGSENGKGIMPSRQYPPSSAFGLSMIPEETTMEGSGMIRSNSSRSSLSLTRPKSAPRGNRAISLTSNPSQQSLTNPAIPISSNNLGQNLTRDVAVPIVSYRGSQTKVTISGLEPNRLYHFKLRYVGSRSNSLLSKPLVIMTKPLPPSKPILVELSPTTVRLKWYASKNGAFKFAVQMFKETITTNAMKKSYASGTPLPGMNVLSDPNDGWNIVFSGQETFWTSTTLSPETSYRIRVVGINYQGTYSDPSEEISFVTPHRAENTKEHLAPRNVDSAFSIECTHDICVGDTILITERLYAKNKAANASNNASATDVMRESISKLRASSGGVGGNNDPRASTSAMSVMSLLSEGKPESLGTFIGERTIAAHVVKDNYKTVRDIIIASSSSSSAYGHPDNGNEMDGNALTAQISKHRKLWLEVVWQRAKSAACKPYEVKPGEVIERLQSKLESYEVFRCQWKQEDQRLPLAVEWESLQSCFQQMDV